jgi:DNA-binding LacI/PurR family transcriptional regulator
LLRVTIKNIAEKAGVSHATVSRALRDHPLVALKTTTRIKQIAADLDYVPSALARSLKNGRSKALGVVVSRIDDPYFSEVLQGIEDVLQHEGYAYFIASSNRDFSREKAIVQIMSEQRVDGIIICSTPVSKDHHRQFKKFGIPIVLVNNQAVEESENSIYHDDQFGNFQLTRHLIELGHTRIGYLGNLLAGRTTEDRLTGFKGEMKAHGLPILDEYIFQGPNGRPEGGFTGGEYFLQLPNRPTAIICFNDMMAIGLIKALRNAELDVPSDCSVVGFDNISISAYSNPSLTTFDQPKYLLGEKAARMMLSILNPSADDRDIHPAVVITRGKILVRNSTGPSPD